MLNNSQITVGGNAVCQKCEHCRCVSPARIRRGWSAQEKRRKSEATGCCLQLISPPEFQIIIWFSTSRLNKTDRLIKQIEFAQNDFRQPVLVFCMAAWRFAHSGHNKGVPEIFGFFFRFGLVEYVFLVVAGLHQNANDESRTWLIRGWIFRVYVWVCVRVLVGWHRATGGVYAPQMRLRTRSSVRVTKDDAQGWLAVSFFVFFFFSDEGKKRTYVICMFAAWMGFSSKLVGSTRTLFEFSSLVGYKLARIINNII